MGCTVSFWVYSLEVRPEHFEKWSSSFAAHLQRHQWGLVVFYTQEPIFYFKWLARHWTVFPPFTVTELHHGIIGDLFSHNHRKNYLWKKLLQWRSPMEVTWLDFCRSRETEDSLSLKPVLHCSKRNNSVIFILWTWLEVTLPFLLLPPPSNIHW